MSLVLEYRATWNVNETIDEFGAWTPHAIEAQNDLETQEQAEAPYTSFVGGIEIRQVGTG